MSSSTCSSNCSISFFLSVFGVFSFNSELTQIYCFGIVFPSPYYIQKERNLCFFVFFSEQKGTVSQRFYGYGSLYLDVFIIDKYYFGGIIFQVSETHIRSQEPHHHHLPSFTCFWVHPLDLLSLHDNYLGCLYDRVFFLSH